jgi:1-aminocyclopropane-1-carboxylate deaminase/D-cysteine desulfhydrase-like pyridoxal-dependent ACC family enzyme
MGLPLFETAQLLKQIRRMTNIATDVVHLTAAFYKFVDLPDFAERSTRLVGVL